MVTSYKIYENIMGNRVTKLGYHIKRTSNSFNPIKAQRVDGLYNHYNNNKWLLRCTLTNFERSSCINKLSDCLIQNIYFTQRRKQCNYSTLNNQDINWWISGLADAVGCFTVKFKQNKEKWTLTLCFTIEIHKRDIDVLNILQNHFNTGHIIYKRLEILAYLLLVL